MGKIVQGIGNSGVVLLPLTEELSDLVFTKDKFFSCHPPKEIWDKFFLVTYLRKSRGKCMVRYQLARMSTTTLAYWPKKDG